MCEMRENQFQLSVVKSTLRGETWGKVPIIRTLVHALTFLNRSSSDVWPSWERQGNSKTKLRSACFRCFATANLIKLSGIPAKSAFRCHIIFSIAPPPLSPQPDPTQFSVQRPAFERADVFNYAAVTFFSKIFLPPFFSPFGLGGLSRHWT